MEISKRRWLAGLIAGGMLIGCGGNSTPPGGGTTDSGPVVTDSGPPADDGTGTDAGNVTDTPVADHPATDRPAAADPCATAVDLSGMTPGSDGAIHAMGDNSTAPAVSLGMLPMNCVNGGRGGAKGSPVVFQYTMRAAGLLRVSTDNMGTDMGFDSIVAVLANCSARAASLACNDDVGMNNLRSTATTAMPLMAGQRVFIVVGGYGMNASGGATGVFELTVRETSPIAAGMPCTAMDVCAAGTACLPTAADATMRVCTADGTQGGHCRVTGTACDMTFTCSQATPTAATPGYCRAAVMVGGDCDRAGQRLACATGSSCHPVPTMAAPGHYGCVADGAAGGVCRAASPRCDTTPTALECSADMPGICQHPVAPGTACDRVGGTTTCTMAAVCAPSSATAAACVATTATPMGIHNTPATRVAPVTHTTVYTGTLATVMDQSCYGVTVPMGGSVFAETGLPATPSCPTGGPDTTLTLFNPMGTMIATNDDIGGGNICSRIDPATVMAAHGLTGGDYTVCVSAFMGSAMGVPSFTLTLAVE